MWRQSSLIIPTLLVRNQSLLQSTSFLILSSNQAAQIAIDSRCVGSNDQVVDQLEVILRFLFHM